MNQEKKACFPLNLQMFADGEAAPEPTPAPEPEPQPNQTPAPPSPTQPLDFDAMFQDPNFKRRLDEYTRKSNETAVRNALQKAQRLQDERLSESERLKEMSADQRAAYWEQKARKEAEARARDKEVLSLRSQTVTMLAEHKVPDMFLDVFDFDSATAESIQQRVAMLAEYEYFPRGEFDKRLADGITAGINEKLKQKSPETHANTGITSAADKEYVEKIRRAAGLR